MKLSPHHGGQGILGLMFGLPLLFLLIAVPLGAALHAVLGGWRQEVNSDTRPVVLPMGISIASCRMAAGCWSVFSDDRRVIRHVGLARHIHFFVHLSIIFGTLSGSVFWWIVGCLESDVFQSLAASPARGALVSVHCRAAIIMGEEWVQAAGTAASRGNLDSPPNVCFREVARTRRDVGCHYQAVAAVGTHLLRQHRSGLSAEPTSRGSDCCAAHERQIRGTAAQHSDTLRRAGPGRSLRLVMPRQ